MQNPKKIKVLVVDDSALMRQSLKNTLEEDGRFYITATASDPYIAVQHLQREAPDVITLDIEMPRMDGLTFLKKIMSQHPLPVVIISGLTLNNREIALRGLELGAVEILNKPEGHSIASLDEIKIQICDTVAAASKAFVRRRANLSKSTKRSSNPKLTADVVLTQGKKKPKFTTTEKIIAVGASTGGTEAIREFLEVMPYDVPAIVIVQHMPELFTKAFADRLNSLCAITIKEAENGDRLLRGQALIAPGNKHLLVKRSGAQYYAEVAEGPLVSRHRPSVDVLFRSLAEYAGSNAIGVIMTGMGDDGSQGLFEMKEAGSYTIAQDEKTSVVFGMPKEAILKGAVDDVLPLPKIAEQVLRKT